MDFIPDPKIDLSDAATVTLAGRSFFVPVLPLRQTIKIATLAPGLAGTVRPRSPNNRCSTSRRSSISP